MLLEDVLTIVVPLKGREEYTRRFLEYAGWINCPFKILLGDGSLKDTNYNLKEFPNIRFEHIRYPYDKDISTYSRKMSDLLSKVKTPLTMLIDNDNFFCLDGIYKVINFLNKHQEYSAGRGCLTRCAISGDKLTSEKRKMHYFPSVIGNSAAERVKNNINLFHTHLHDIVKTDILQATHEIISIVASNDFKIFIRLNALCSVVHGNNYRNDNFTYFFHEDGTPRIKGQVLPLDKLWVTKPYWDDTCARLASAVGTAISYIDNKDLYESKKFFIEEFISHMMINEDSNHRIPDKEVELKKHLINSIDRYIQISNDLRLDDEILASLKKERTIKKLNIDNIECKDIEDDEFRKILNQYLKQRKYCWE